MIIPSLIVRDVPEEIGFLTQVLDFKLAFAAPEDGPFYAVLTRAGDELHLNLAHGARPYGHSSAIVVCTGIDAPFASFVARGLRVPSGTGSPVHQGPLDQTRGTREVYLDDPSGNTIIFQQRQEPPC